MGDRVLLGMSGGVDSAAAAVLLRQAGCEPVGCTLRLVSSADIGREGSCCSLEDVEDARAVAARLGIDFFVFNFKDLFRRQVMDHFVAEYQAGRTPNPCVQCNRYVKFAALLRRADDLGIPYIATGHYARVAWDQAAGRWQLLRGVDRRKDQSYFLYPLTRMCWGGCACRWETTPRTRSGVWRRPRGWSTPASGTARISALSPMGTTWSF